MKNQQNDPRHSLLSPNVNVIMKGRLLWMRPISQNEITDEYVGWLNDPSINRYLGVRHACQTTASIIRYINGLRSKQGCELFAIFLKKDNRHIGGLSIVDYDIYNGTANYGIMIGNKQALLSGYAAEATVLFLEYIFSDSKIRRLSVSAIAHNVKAWRLMEAMGFQREGILRQHSVLYSGEICDFYYYGILREEWMNHRKKLKNLLEYIRHQNI